MRDDDFGFTPENDDFGFEPEAPSAPEKPSLGEAILRHGLQGASLGTADEAAGIGTALGDKLGAWMYPEGGPAGDFWKNYETGKEAYNKRSDDAYAAHPTASTLSGLGGGLLLGGEGALANGIVGAVNAAGSSKADLTKGEWRPFLEDVGVGAGLSAAAGAAAPYIAKPIGKVAGKVTAPISSGIKKLFNKGADAAEEQAGLRAFKAANPELRDYLSNKDAIKAAAESGNAMLDEGAVGLFDNAKGIAKKLAPKQQEAIAQLNAAKEALDSAAHAQGKHLNADDIAEYLDRDVIDKFRKNPADRDIVTALEEETNAIRSQYGAKPETQAAKLTFSQGEENLKTPLAKKAFEKSGDKRTGKALQELAGATGSKIEQDALKVDPEAYKTFVEAKNRLANLIPAKKMAEKGAVKLEKNRWNSLGDMVTSGSVLSAALMSHNPASALAIWAGTKGMSKLTRERGAAFTANVARTTGNILRAAAGRERTAAALLVENPGKLGRFFEDLANAAARSEDDFLQVHAALAHDPEYRKIIRKNDRMYRQTRQ